MVRFVEWGPASFLAARRRQVLRGAEGREEGDGLQQVLLVVVALAGRRARDQGGRERRLTEGGEAGWGVGDVVVVVVALGRVALVVAPRHLG